MTKQTKVDEVTKAKLKELRQVKRAYPRLKEEHELLKSDFRVAGNKLQMLLSQRSAHFRASWCASLRSVPIVLSALRTERPLDQPHER